MTFCTPSSDSCLVAAAVLEDRDTPRKKERERERDEFNRSSLDIHVVVDTLICTNPEQLDKHVLQSLLDSIL